jgi:arabinofuranosyltransferase
VRRRLDLLLLVPLVALLAYWQWQYRGYVKDDTFISLRYARNLAYGHGLVFNYGDRLEGYTNFLWVLLATPAYWFKVEALTWVKVLACLFGQLGLLVTWEATRFFGGRSHAFGWTAAALWAGSASVILWSMAGLEPTLMACLCSGGTLLAMKVWDSEDEPIKLAVAAGAVLAMAGLCRPDAHAVIAMAGGFAGIDCLRRRKLRKAWLVCGAVILGVLVPYHLFRYAYFGDWLPNTYYVKAAAGPEVRKRGLEFAGSLLGFTWHPVVFAVAPLALIGRKRVLKLWALALCAFFVAYLVKIGRDEMKWFRLYLPVLPLLLALFADAGRVLVAEPIRSKLGTDGWKGWVPAVPAVALAAGLLPMSLGLAADKADWHGNYVRWSEKSFMAMGRYIAERSETGDVVAFQDMGAAPISAPDQVWIDTIGILNRTVAKELAAIELNPFMRGEKAKTPGGSQQIREFDARIRDYVYDQDPEWLAFIAYVPRRQRSKFNKAMKAAKRDRDEQEQNLRRRIDRNTHAHGISKDSRFDDYEYVRYWKRNMGYWLVLYRKAD